MGMPRTTAIAKPMNSGWLLTHTARQNSPSSISRPNSTAVPPAVGIRNPPTITAYSCHSATTTASVSSRRTIFESRIRLKAWYGEGWPDGARPPLAVTTSLGADLIQNSLEIGQVSDIARLELGLDVAGAVRPEERGGVCDRFLGKATVVREEPRLHVGVGDRLGGLGRSLLGQVLQIGSASCR